MTDGNNPGDGAGANNDPTPSNPDPKPGGSSSGAPNENYVPQHRFNEVNRQKKDLEQRLSKIEADQAAQEEERAKKQGEFESLANKYKAQVDTEKQKRQQAEGALVRYKRMTTWREAARGVIRDEALDDAFSMLDEDDWGNTDDTDAAAMTRLAEILADRKPYLSEGPRGAGSGFGSRTPVLERASTARGQQENGSQKSIKPIFKKRSRRQWK